VALLEQKPNFWPKTPTQVPHIGALFAPLQLLLLLLLLLLLQRLLLLLLTCRNHR
jgi:hypothetical protein